MAKIPILFEPGRADGKLANSNAIFDENKGMFQSEINDIQDTLNSDNPNKPLSAKQGKVLKELLDTKVIEAGGVPIDTEPTEGNTANVVTSDGIYKALAKKVNDITFKEENAKLSHSIESLNTNTGISEYPEFSEAKAYAVGEVVLYEGLLKRFTSAHEAGAWDASQAEAWSEKKEVDEKIRELKEDAAELEQTINGSVITYIFASAYSWGKSFTKITAGTTVINIGEISVNLYEEANSGSSHTRLNPNDTIILQHNVTILRSIENAGAATIKALGTKDEIDKINNNINNFGIALANEISRATKSESEIIKVIGEEAQEYAIHLELEAYTSLRVDISAGCTITSFGDYNGSLLLSSEYPFNSSTFITIRPNDLPYTILNDVKALRTNKVINSDITIEGLSSGIKADISVLRESVQNLESRINELSTRFILLPNYVAYSGDMIDGTIVDLEKNSVRSNQSFSFTAQIGTFNKIRIGRGKPTEKLYSSSWIDIDNENIVVTKYYSDSNFTENSYPHGLDIKNTLQILIACGIESMTSITLISNGKSFTQSTSWGGFNGTLFAESIGSTLNNVRFSWTCKKLSCDIWLFGDSYFSTTSRARWLYYLLDAGYKDVLINGYPGASCTPAYNDVITLLKHNTPKYIVWCLGMNNRDTDEEVNEAWFSTYESLKTLCKDKNIELILTTIPTAKGGYVEDTGDYNMRINKHKNAIVRNSTLRYIDFDKAVDANEDTGEWYDGMLHTDGTHPTEEGAKTLFVQAIADFPELMSAEDF